MAKRKKHIKAKVPRRRKELHDKVRLLEHKMISRVGEIPHTKSIMDDPEYMEMYRKRDKLIHDKDY